MEATARATAPEDGATQTATHDGFQIAATASFHEIRPRTLKHNDTFAVFDHSGDINNWPGSSEGLYRHDTRHLSHYFLTLNGGIRPILLSSSIRDDNSVLTCDLSNPDIKNAAGEQVLQNDLIHLRRTRFIFDAKLYERLTLTNFCTGSCPISLELHFAGDFADLFEVRGATRSHRGTMLAPEVSADSVASHQRFRDKYGLKMPLLSDVGGAVCKAYGVWKNPGISRQTFVVDEAGRILRHYDKVDVSSHAAQILAELA